MIGTIRKHSAWLWWVVALLTIVSFIWWGASPGTRYGSGRNGGLGIIYGKPVTAERLAAAQREFLIYYWMRYGEFPDKSPNFSRADLDRGSYERLMLVAKATQLGVHVSKEAEVAGANDFLRSIGRNGEPVSMSQFVERILAPEGLTVADFESLIADDLAIQQLVQTLGLSGTLLSPQEAGQLYDRDHQEVSAQAVFFSASNYLSQVVATPQAVGLFYTNYMASYRVADRMQINYVEYDLSNYLAAAEQKLGATNLANQVEAYYAQKGMEAVPDAKTPAEAKAKIRQGLLRQAAGGLAAEQAKQFVTTLFAMDPVSPSNLLTAAKSSGLTVHTTAPFTATEGPTEFAASADFVKTAFKLNADSPFSKPLAGTDAIYVIGLDKELPSAVQPFSEIKSRVAEDFRNTQAILKARAAGTNFYVHSLMQIATGKTFAQAALGAGQTPVALHPFSLSSTEVPEAEGHADLNQLKNAAFSTPVGHVSQFTATEDGGLVLFVQSVLPVDESAKAAGLPSFITQLRHRRESEAFNHWLQEEENRELMNTPIPAEMANEKSNSR
jgi:hypothetical protein